jgi:hypothetical protein
MNPSQIEAFNLKNGSLRLYIICFRFQTVNARPLFMHKNKIRTDADLSVTPFLQVEVYILLKKLGDLEKYL